MSPLREALADYLALTTPSIVLPAQIRRSDPGGA